VNHFRFCPACGAELEPSSTHDGGSYCRQCRRSWYRNAAPTAGAAVVRDGKVLVAVRAFEPEKGKVNVPGGFLDYDEDPVSGLKREIREETGIEVVVGEGDYVQAVPHTYGPGGDWVLALGFVAEYAGGEPEPTDDVAELKWVGLSEIDELDWAWSHDKNLVRKALMRHEAS
jgi:ADP-ribose pyrophosphatase YjhB (NUDIX family)